DKALVVGSISKPVTLDGFDTYSVDMFCPTGKQAYRFRVESSSAPVSGGFPADVVIEGREKAYFIRYVEPGSYFIARQAVDITNTFTTYTFGQRGQLTERVDLQAGDVVYLGEHEFVPLHDSEFFLWRDVVAPEYRIRNAAEEDRRALESLYPGFDWDRMRNPGLELQDGNHELIEESDVWINPFGLY
ncbi:MAG: hypothetical protein R3270_10730, partial [Gammaproteobacteria bacterium]|nr:hypothetical protein [Gammaproteobacteria bacterium]